MLFRCRVWCFWICAICFCISIRLCIISYDASLPEGGIRPPVDVTVTRQQIAATAATTSTVSCTAGNSVPSVNCQERDIRLPDHIISRCPNTSQTCLQIKCDKLLSEPLLVDAAMTNYTAWRKAAAVSDSDVAKLAADCVKLRRSRGFDRNTSPSSVDNDDFPLAFNILAHRDADQMTRLLQSIYRPHNVYCIHVDAQSSSDFQFAVRHVAACFDNVRLASKLESIVYAGFSRLQADITCMKDHLSSSVQWKYLINTAAQAFPLKTVEEMVQVLRLYNGANDIEGLYGSRILHSRFRDEWREDVQHRRMVKTGNKNPLPPHDIDIVRGSAYGIFSRAFVRFILEDRRARDLLQWSRATYSPDELYWATLHHTYSNPHLHTPGAFSGYPSDKPWLAVYANWAGGDKTPCHGRYVRGVCVFGVGDLSHLVQRREFFANKFYSDSEPLALDCLAAWLRRKELCPPRFEHDFYSKLPFILKPRDDVSID